MDQTNKNRSTDKDAINDDALKKRLKQQFQQMEENIRPPKSLKEDVFTTLDSLSLVADILGLFTVDFIESEITILDAMTNKNKDENMD